jgi:membrane protease YdiL (CAAX protease family)
MTMTGTRVTPDAKDKHIVRYSLRWPVIGTLVAIAATTTVDAVGASAYVANSLLLPLFLLLWYLQHLSRAEIGLTGGRGRDYALAVCYPAVVLALAGLIAWLSGAINLAAIDLATTAPHLVFLILITILGAIVTEDGFFRGWLWASLQRAGVTERGLLVWTSVAFGVWHLPMVLLSTDFHIPIAQVPILVVNAGVIGLNWALMRQRSGSIVVASVSHGIWNGLVYTLFNDGPALGVLGIHNTGVFGPETGLIGLALNLAFAAILWLGFNRARGVKAVA